MKTQWMKEVKKNKNISGITAEYIVEKLFEKKSSNHIRKIIKEYLEIDQGLFAKVGGFFCYSSAEQRFKQRFRLLSEALSNYPVKTKKIKKIKEDIERHLVDIVKENFDVKTLLTNLLQCHKTDEIKHFMKRNEDFFLYKNNQLNPYCLGNNENWVEVFSKLFE